MASGKTGCCIAASLEGLYCFKSVCYYISCTLLLGFFPGQ